MVTTWLAGFRWRSAGYQPRHRSPRRDDGDIDWLTEQVLDDPSWDPLLTEAGQPDSPGSSTDESWLGSGSVEPEFMSQITSGEIRGILEGCAINDDLTNIVPELVRVIADSSHTNGTLTSAWNEFQEATRDAYALHLHKRAWWEFFGRQDLGSCPEEQAVEMKLSLADDAWGLIRHGYR
jgi:hypothetical protein